MQSNVGTLTGARTEAQPGKTIIVRIAAPTNILKAAVNMIAMSSRFSEEAEDKKTSSSCLLKARGFLALLYTKSRGQYFQPAP